MLIAVSPAFAQLSKESSVNIYNVFGPVTVVVEVLLGIATFLGLINAFRARRYNVMGLKSFSNYVPSLFALFNLFLFTLVWKLLIDPSTIFITVLAMWNLTWFAYLLREALLNSSFD